MKKREKIKELEQRIAALEGKEEPTTSRGLINEILSYKWTDKPSTKEAFEAQNKPEQKTLEEYLKPDFSEGWRLCWDGEIYHDENVNQEDVTVYSTKKEALLAQRFFFLRRVAEKCEGYGEGYKTVFYSASSCELLYYSRAFNNLTLEEFQFKTEDQAQHFIAEATRLGLNDWEDFKN